jgi:hypothetical protein
MYPVPDGDAVFFLPAIRSYAVNGVIEHQANPLSYVTDPKGFGRYLFYPPMFMVIVGGVVRSLGLTSYPGILMVLATMRVASVAIFAIAIQRLARRRYGAAIPPMVTVVAVLLVMSNGLFLLASNGRPEVLTLLLANAATLVAVAAPAWKDVALPLIAGLMFSFSIASGVIGFAMYAVYLCFAQRSCTRRFLLATVAGVLMVALFVAGYSVAGIDMGDGIAGIGLHSKIQLTRTSTQSLEEFCRFWTSWFLFFAIACINVARKLSRRVVEMPEGCSRIQFVAAVLLLAATILFFGRCAPSHYNIYAFLPIYQALAFAGFLACDALADPAIGRGGRTTDGAWAWPHQRIVRGPFLATLVVAASLACGHTAMQLLPFPYYLLSGCDYRSMKEVFDGVLAEHPETLFLYTGGLQLLDDSLAGSMLSDGLAGSGSLSPFDEHGRFTSPRARHEGREKERSIVFIQERATYQVPPRLPPHLHKIVIDATDEGPAPLPIRGLRILRSRQGYGFTAFEQEPEEAIQAARP